MCLLSQGRLCRIHACQAALHTCLACRLVGSCTMECSLCRGCETANVSGTVTLHASGLPLAQGKRVVPSGRLLFSSIMLTGSFTAWIWASLMALHYDVVCDCDAVVLKRSCDKIYYYCRPIIITY